MAEYIDATNNPEAFIKAYEQGKKVFADLGGNTHIEWNGTNLLYVWPCHRHEGDYRSSVFPGMFKRNDPIWEAPFKFYDQINGS